MITIIFNQLESKAKYFNYVLEHTAIQTQEELKEIKNSRRASFKTRRKSVFICMIIENGITIEMTITSQRPQNLTTKQTLYVTISTLLELDFFKQNFIN